MSTKLSNDLVRYFRLDFDRQRLAAEAFITLASASLLLAVRPFRRAIRFGSVELSNGMGAAGDCLWAVEAAARRAPWRTVCIHKGLALQHMLRRRGHDARLHFGIGKDEAEGQLQAHVWVTLDGVPLIGGGEAHRFAPVAVYP